MPKKAKDNNGLSVVKTESPTEIDKSEGRGKGGLFAKGCKPGPGRPKKEVEKTRYEALLRGIDPLKLQQATEKCLDLACRGDVHAFAVIVKMLLGNRSIYEIKKELDAKAQDQLGGLVFNSSDQRFSITIEHGTTMADVRRAMGLSLRTDPASAEKRDEEIDDGEDQV